MAFYYNQCITWQLLSCFILGKCDYLLNVTHIITVQVLCKDVLRRCQISHIVNVSVRIRILFFHWSLIVHGAAKCTVTEAGIVLVLVYVLIHSSVCTAIGVRRRRGAVALWNKLYTLTTWRVFKGVWPIWRFRGRLWCHVLMKDGKWLDGSFWESWKYILEVTGAVVHNGVRLMVIVHSQLIQ